jgi:indolepyruvate ferredoxin oxidoreductase
MVYNAAIGYPADETLLSRLDVRTRSLAAFDALAAAEKLFGDTAAANFLVVGAAYQAGGIPVSADAIEEAITINGVAVAMNHAAFRWGRVAVADPDVFRSATAPAIPERLRATGVVERLLENCPVTGPVRELLELRSADLVDYQGRRAAAGLVDLVQRVWKQERTATHRTDLSEAVARNFFKLIAYKDEYEVARMLTDPAFVESVKAAVPGGDNLTFKLHPPVLKALGRKTKISMGPRTHVVLRMLAKGKCLRGRFIDPFGHTRMRRLERRLITHYQATITGLLPTLGPHDYDRAVAVASAPELIRGYEEVKLRNLGVYAGRLAQLGVDASAVAG